MRTVILFILFHPLSFWRIQASEVSKTSEVYVTNILLLR